MACNICGSTRHETNTGGCPNQELGMLFASKPIGWLCPACHKGNAPDVKGCVHCAKSDTKATIGGYYDNVERAGG
jgi:hypothetical protein